MRVKGKPFRDGLWRTCAVKFEPADEFGPFVYFLEGHGMLKIGTATSLTRRLTDIAQSSPVRLSLLSWGHGDAVLERLLHGAFYSNRHHGEWFKISGRLETFLLNLIDLESPADVDRLIRNTISEATYLSEVEPRRSERLCLTLSPLLVASLDGQETAAR